MTGWLLTIALAGAVLAGLWWFARPGKAAIQFAAAALLLALAGYAWQGRPGLPGSPASRANRPDRPPSGFDAARRELLGEFNTSGAWLNIAESYHRRGNTEGAAELLQNRVQRNPRDMVLWLGLGSALVAHSGGLMTSAAEMAFRRAARLAPNHPAPPFFYAVALADGGNFLAAERIWRNMLATGRLSPQWRGAIEPRLQVLDQARALDAAGTGRGPTAATPAGGYWPASRDRLPGPDWPPGPVPPLPRNPGCPCAARVRAGWRRKRRCCRWCKSPCN